MRQGRPEVFMHQAQISPLHRSHGKPREARVVQKPGKNFTLEPDLVSGRGLGPWSRHTGSAVSAGGNPFLPSTPRAWEAATLGPSDCLCVPTTWTSSGG